MFIKNNTHIFIQDLAIIIKDKRTISVTSRCCFTDDTLKNVWKSANKIFIVVHTYTVGKLMYTLTHTKYSKILPNLLPQLSCLKQYQFGNDWLILQNSHSNLIVIKIKSG